MKLLIITQKIDQNDDNLGFFNGWVEEFAKKTEKIIVIAQFVGEYDLPENVEVYSIGKEKGYSKIRQLLNFYKLLFKNLPKIDAVFAHMIPMWVVLGWPIYKIYRKEAYLWYVHKKVNFMLKVAEKIVRKIFTASKESCRLKSDKIVITGHGIDTNKFRSQISPQKKSTGQANLKSGGKFKIITAGRVAPSKNIHLLIEVAEVLRKINFNFEIKIAGSSILEQDKIYFEKLKNLVEEKNLQDEIKFAGKILNKNITEFYQKGDLFINLSDTGSIDKAVLEAMASGILVLTSNEAFKNILAEKYFTAKNPEEIAEKILALSKDNFDPSLRDYVVENHSLENLAGTISDVLIGR